MNVRSGNSQPTFISALTGSVSSLLNRGLVRDAQTFIAAYTMWACDAVESGALTGSEATEAYVALELILDKDMDQRLSDTTHEIILEGEHLHHYGDESHSVAAPDLPYLRQLALRVLMGTAQAA